MKLSDTMRALVEKKNAIKVLEKEVRELNNQMIAEHERADLDILLEDGFQSKLTHACRKTPLIPEIEKLLGRPLPDECYKLTPYESVAVKFVGDNAMLLNEAK